MLKSHEKFHSANGKRLVLVAEDEEINREILSEILKEDYEVITAADGNEALQLIHEYQSTLSIVLLDLLMPGMTGLELLQKLKDDPSLQIIPVIVLTSDQESEIKSLTLGAADFIPKPYPAPGVVLARIRRTIELFEDRLTIQTTERDPLTNLYNREFFYHYAELFDQYHESMEMDAIIIDIYHFRVINERFGNTYGDEILRRIGLKVREMVSDTGGIVCRREADTFMVYCPHGKDYKQILESASNGLTDEDMPVNRIRLRMGVYANVDRSLPIERRFDRAKMAVDMIRGSYTKTIEIYDHKLHEKEVFEQQLVEGFHQALTERQFKVYYQPKFDIRQEKPMLTSAEALVRWIHPQFGFISPGQFIPLFEDNGLIQELDLYVWETTAQQIRDWKDRLGYSVPISVNVSRVDMYDPHLVDSIRSILIQHKLDPSDLLLEVTESAYTHDSEQIIATVNYLRKCGFRIEMDDFGNGYSSLNMLSTLPIDALKLDMDFVQNAFRRRNDTRMLEIIIDIADYLSVPVIAEGVETEYQMKALKAIGCDIVQGFYFSKPVSPMEFETFLVDFIQNDLRNIPSLREENAIEIQYNQITGGFESIYYVDLNDDHYVEYSSAEHHEELKIDRSGKNFFTDIVRTFHNQIHPDDLEEVLRCLRKDNLLFEVNKGHQFTLTFRILIQNEPVYYTLKAVLSPSNDNHIIIGISNVDHDIKISRAFELIHPNALDFNALAHALTIDMETIYYVDVQSDSYICFKSNTSQSHPLTESAGLSFSDLIPQAIIPAVLESDRKKVLTALDKNSLLNILRSRNVHAITYRTSVNNRHPYYRMKMVPANRNDSRHVIIGISNIDSQITNEERLRSDSKDDLSFAGIARALAKDYFSIYIVDTETDRFYEYNADPAYKTLQIPQSGSNFFELSRKNAEKTVYHEDLPRFLSSFTKTNILNALRTQNAFTITYRLLIQSEPTYVNMKITSVEGPDAHQIVVGISNIHNGISHSYRSLPFTGISQALAGDYFCIYYLDIHTDDFIKFVAHDDQYPLQVEKTGENFFETFQRTMLDQIHPDDAAAFFSDFTREHVYEQIAAQHPYILTYRQLIQGQWHFVQLKATANQNNDDGHIVIGISNIDNQIHRYNHHSESSQLIYYDMLTGAKNKRAYHEDEIQINKDILSGNIWPFAVVSCDLKGLHKINSNYGYPEGNEFLKQMVRTLRHIYKNSPVYRVGGDKFAIILRDADYENRDHLLKMLNSLNYAFPVGRHIVIAAGMSEYDPNHDTTLSEVAARADVVMYENKENLKKDFDNQ